MKLCLRGERDGDLLTGVGMPYSQFRPRPSPRPPDGGDQRDAHYAEFHTWLKKKYAEYGKTDTWFR